ncbi:MAG: class I SAM-dependent methyltransferase [bacterium]
MMQQSYNIQVDPEHYADLRYDTKSRFASYWHQADEITRRKPASVLEVGIGNGFLHRYLEQLGIGIHTCDFDERLGPQTVASVLDLPFGDGEFDMVCCFETLEHLPFGDFDRGLDELCRVASRYVLISLPDVTPYVRVDIKGSVGRIVNGIKDLPNLRPRTHKFDGEHYWEVGKRGYALEDIVARLTAHGLILEDNFRVFEQPYHRFLSCRKA